MSNQCNCAELPDMFGLNNIESAFRHLELLAEKEDGSRTLYRCQVCSRHWQLDDWDIIKSRLAIRIDHPQQWIDFDDKSIRMTFLVNSRGGLSEEKCTWPGCESWRVSGLLYCAFHATEI